MFDCPGVLFAMNIHESLDRLEKCIPNHQKDCPNLDQSLSLHMIIGHPKIYWIITVLVSTIKLRYVLIPHVQTHLYIILLVIHIMKNPILYAEFVG